MKATRKKIVYLWCACIFLVVLFGAFFIPVPSVKESPLYNRLNDQAYAFHYRSIDSVEYYCQQLLCLSAGSDDGAENANNRAFAYMAKMDYEAAEHLLDSIPEMTDNQLELLICYVQQMRLCQRRSRNREFYDFRERAISCLKRINEGRDMLTERQQNRLRYAESEYAIVNSTYYYYVGLEHQSIDALQLIDPSEVQKDTAQFLNYLYNIGAGGILSEGSAAEIHQEELDYLLRCFQIARRNNYPYFIANAMEAIAEHIISAPSGSSVSLSLVNPHQIPDDHLPVWLAEEALLIFQDYGDVYQIAGAYRTLASCFLAQGDYEHALQNLELALSDTLILQAPDLVASIREQLSVAYSAIDDKYMSDYNRNIYLDLQEQTRQDRSLEARAGQLDESVAQLNLLLISVSASLVLLILLLSFFSYRYWVHQKQKKTDEHTDEQEELKEQLALRLLHVENGERRALEQRAKVSLVNSITPLIDRMLLEVQKDRDLQYVGELADKINEQNSMLTHWIQLQQGELNLHIESFALQPLFDMLGKGRMSFQMKGLVLEVVPTDCCVKADRVLTLFMLNTLADNARKFTEAGGSVSISAIPTADYVEISVSDTGAGMDEEQLAHAFDHKMSGGHGFGLLNCRGIIEKYRKMSRIFSVCVLSAESRVGEGSRFFFRLPKGVVRMVFLLWLSCFAAYVHASDLSLPMKAKDYSDSCYFSNIAGSYKRTLDYADSCRLCLNAYYLSSCPLSADTLLSMGSQTDSPEILWLHQGVQIDYNIILDMRNESAIAALALHQWDVYAYNNRLYTQLFKELSADTTLDQYCRKMQQSQVDKTIAIVLLVLVLITILVAVIIQVVHSLNRSAQRRKAAADSLELMRDELRRVELEEAKLHVSNAVLDNALSALKHETMYYPSRIEQLISTGETQSLREVVGYYRELYGMLSEQALHQTEGVKLHLKTLSLNTLIGTAATEDVSILGDENLLRYLFEILRKQTGQRHPSITYAACQTGFVEVSVPIPNTLLNELQRQDLFAPIAANIPFLLCRQIVRDHSEALQQRAIGVRAESSDEQTVIKIILPKKQCKTSKSSS